MEENELRIELDGTLNTRDLGGIKTKDNKVIKKGRLIRSDKLINLSSKDIKFFESLPLKYDLDLRRPNEVRFGKDKEIKGCTFLNLTMTDDPKERQRRREENRHEPFPMIPQAEYERWVDRVFYAFDKNGDISKGFELMYRNLVSYKPSIESIRKCMEIFKDNKEGAVLFHCSEGKDRTGVLALVLLLALDVDISDIVKDYLKTVPNRLKVAESNYQKWLSYDIPNEKLCESRKMIDIVRENWILAAYDEINTKFNGITSYLHNQIGFSDDDILELRKNYLE